MNAALALLQTGAVTSVGLTAPQTCAAIRARVAGFRQTILTPVPFAPVIAARIPAAPKLKRSPRQWLVNLAVRAIRECCSGIEVNYPSTALLLTLRNRGNLQAATDGAGRDIADEIIVRLEKPFHASSHVMEQGHAGSLIAFEVARSLLSSNTVEACIVGGVDSLVNADDVSRLSDSGRLLERENPQGLIPGEAAAFAMVCRTDAPRERLAEIVGIGNAAERDTVLGDRYSTGHGMRDAMERACEDAGKPEPTIAFRVSDMNGERYKAWEALFATARFYRTRRRACFPVWYPASSVGDVGAATGALGVVFAADAIHNGYAPGPIGMCEAGSDDGARAACLLAPAPGSRTPPFRYQRPVRQS